MKDIPTKNLNENTVVALYYCFKIIPLLISGFSIYLGYQLFILGVTGQASLSVNSEKVSGQLLNAAPGIFFAVGGLLTIAISVWKGVKMNFSDNSLASTCSTNSQDYTETTAHPPDNTRSNAKGGGSTGGTGHYFRRQMSLMDKFKDTH